MMHGSERNESPGTQGLPVPSAARPDDNPYAAPRSAVVDEPPPRRMQLAEPWQRLVARLIDNGIVIALVFGMGFVAEQFTTLPPVFADDSLMSAALYSGLGFAIFLVVQGPLLRSSGQTWGKRVFGIYIVDMSRRKPEFWKLVFVRDLPFQLIYIIPVAGQIAALINALMIGRTDHRCGHDLLAGTQVVRFLKEPPDAGQSPA